MLSKRLFLSLILAIVISFAGIALSPSDADAAYVFHSGFETGNTFEFTSVTGTPTIVKEADNIWIKPSGFNDPSSGWVNEANAYDGNTSTYAESGTISPSGWTTYLELIYGNAAVSSIRFYPSNQAVNPTTAEVDVYDGSSWLNVYSATPTYGAWNTVNFTKQTVTKARIRFYRTSTGTGRLFELEFRFSPKTGTYAMRYNTSAAQAYVIAPGTPYAGTFYLYIATSPDADTTILGSGSLPNSGVKLKTTRALELWVENSARVTSAVLDLATWYRVSLSSIFAAPNFTYYLWLNGSPVGSYTTPYDNYFQPDLGVRESVTADLYFDDLILDNARRVDFGDIRVLLSLPNAAGNLTEFDTTVGSATHWQNVDDAPLSSFDTDYNQHAAASAKADLYGLQDSATIGVSSVQAVSIWYRMQRGTGSAAVHQSGTRDNAANQWTTQTLTTSFAWYSKYLATMPQDGGAWTDARFDALEAGAYHSDTGAQDTYISEIMVMVAYLVSAAVPTITVSPTSYDFGVIAASSTPSTTTTYFTITNSSTMQTDQTIAVTTSTWSGGVGWTHSDTATAGADTAGLKANKGGSWGVGDVIVKFTSPNFIAENQAASTDYSFGLKLIAPTSMTDGVQKSIIVRITAAAG